MQLCTEERASEEVRTASHNVVDFGNKLENKSERAQVNLCDTREPEAKYSNKRTKERNIHLGRGQCVVVVFIRSQLTLSLVQRIICGNGEKLCANYSTKRGDKENLYHANLLNVAVKER
ncbi:hypothetical protein ACJMK2_028557 [Sinanodonta woodiana]|uniref:Uncharacterized protein n=1 Tax=Sinanodonta woodiana TaxID=1069815 RepID=A0ABD3X7G7_SINWO